MGVDYVEGGYPLSNEKDAEFFQRARELCLKQAKICAFGMTRRKGIKAYDDPGMQALLQSEAPVCTIVGKTWEFSRNRCATCHSGREPGDDRGHNTLSSLGKDGR